jgi:hypothetical protein
MHDPETLRRRVALAAIFEETADSIVDRIAAEAARASGLTSLAAEFVGRYTVGIHGTLPGALDAVRESDPAVQAAKLDGVAANIRAVSETHHVPRLIERGLMVVAFRVVSEFVRRNAPARGFTPEQLDAELKWLQQELEHRLG